MTGPIVVGYDASQESQRAVDWALTAAQQRNLPLVVASVWSAAALEFGATGAEASVEFAEEAQGALEKEHAALVALATAEYPQVSLTGEIVSGRPAGALLKRSKEASMLVVGSHGRGKFKGMRLGGVSRQVATHAKCPVVVVRPPAEGATTDILIGVDGSEHSLRALEWAFEQASLTGSALRVLHTWEIPPSWSVADSPSYEPEPLIAEFGNTELRTTAEAMAGFRERYPDVNASQEVMRGSAVKSLVKASQGVGTLVLGSRGHGGFVGLLLGSVSHATVHRAACTTVVVH